MVGIRGGCAKTVRSLARAVLTKGIAFETSKSLEETLARLSAVRGLGERERYYIAMRVYGEPDAFPIYDHALRRAVSTKGSPVSPAELDRLSQPWRPWRAYAAMHLWAANTEASPHHQS